MVCLRIAILGFFAQLMLLVSIFDIYFKSPIISGIPIQPVDYEPPADRLVLFVADGLRADTFYSYANGNSVYFKYVKFIIEVKYFFCINMYTFSLFRKLLETIASYGISHGGVPTESRPGHIALIAGFYEDPSAIFKVPNYIVYYYFIFTWL